MSKTIKLPCHGIVITLGAPDPERPGAFTGGSIESDLLKNATGEGDDPKGPLAAALNAIESFVLACASAGMTVDAPMFLEAIETTVDAVCNHYDDEDDGPVDPAVVGQLLDLVKSLDAPETALDDLVHDAAQEAGLGTLNTLEGEQEQEDHISGVESDASEVNNRGFEGQITFLLEQGVAREEIEKALREHLPAVKEEGRLAAIQHKERVDNPYSELDEPERAAAWQEGYNEELGH